MLNFDQSNFKTDVLSAKNLVLVDFWAPWCGPCKMLAPVIEEIAEDYSEKLSVGKVNIDDNQELAEKYEIVSIPTVCLFQNGQVVSQIVGFRSKKELVAEINKHLS